MKNIKKIVALVLAMVLVAGLSVAGTVAYLTDRDAKTNIFTVGNVDISLNEAFGQGAALVPGVEINKVPTITNNGPTDAWVWMTFSIPSALDNFVQGTEQGSNKNIIHWNPLGATTDGYVTEERVANAIQKGLLPNDIT
ncbi:MAG: SipW-dependent-type signal peptide-containing protein, partial [Oscillospiraceae bacterium]|nr:SipW-dependent-type signal peptide-containing protein [Oscillospiraceae bacterium]